MKIKNKALGIRTIQTCQQEVEVRTELNLMFIYTGTVPPTLPTLIIPDQENLLVATDT